MAKAPPAQCVTVEHPGLVTVIRAPVRVRPAFNPAITNPLQPPTGCDASAIWDTGATGSVITDKIVQACALKPISIRQVHGVHGVDLSPAFLVNIELPNVGFSNITVTLGKLPPDSDVLIGMDIICRGDFAITNHQGKTVFSFRCPSVEKIDFVGDRPSNVNPYAGQVSRNAPCPCGSGKKYKRCHGDPNRSIV
jgi:SEC-C motif/Aspartyl protease